mgnify:CR=1 FL=1
MMVPTPGMMLPITAPAAAPPPAPIMPFVRCAGLRAVSWDVSMPAPKPRPTPPASAPSVVPPAMPANGAPLSVGPCNAAPPPRLVESRPEIEDPMPVPPSSELPPERL